MNSTNQETKLKTLPGPWSLGEMTGNWRDIDLPDHCGVMRIVWKMEGDEGRNYALEAQAHAVVAALNAASSSAPPAEQQAAQVIIDFSQVGTAGPFPVANGRVSLPDATMQDLARMLRPTYETEQQAAPKAAPTRTALPEGWTDCTIEFGNDGPEVVAYGPKRMMNRLAKWLGKYFAQVIADAAPKAAPGVGNSGFDHKTAADFLNGKTVSDEAVRKFVAASRWAHDERAALSATLLAMHGVLTSREAEIALLKRSLLDAEADAAAPQPTPTAQAANSVQEDAARYRWLIDQHWIQTEVDWRLMSTDQDSTIKQLDAAIDAALAAQGGK